MRYYIISGEKSGDMHAGKLITAIQQTDKQAIFRGWGGNSMREAGIEPVIDYKELATIGLGFITVFKKLYKYLQFCKQDICLFKPDAIILIDYSGFNLRIAKFAKKANLQTFYYISPKIWAWNMSRIHKIKAYVDRMFVIFPFEKKLYEKHNYYSVDYVGNQLVEEIKNYKKNLHFLSNNLSDDRPIIALLPGSRIQEIKKILPTMLTLVSKLPTYQFIVAGLKEIPPTLYLPVINIPGVSILYDQTYDILAHATIAVVGSGTATLETALFQVPQIVVYKMDIFSYRLAKWLIKTPYISLVNILLEKEVVRELIQKKLNTENLLIAVQELIQDKVFRETQLDDYKVIKKLLGNKNASETTAQHILEHLTLLR